MTIHILFYTIRKVSSQEISTLSKLYANLSSSDHNIIYPWRTESMVCGESISIRSCRDFSQPGQALYSDADSRGSSPRGRGREDTPPCRSKPKCFLNDLFFLYCALIHLEFLISSSCYRIHSIRPTGEDEESRVETRERTYEPNSTEWKEWGRSPENIWYLCAVSPTYDKSPQDPTATLRQSFRYIHTILIYVIDRSLVRPNYQEDVSALVENTRDIVKQRLQGDAWIMWAIAQRASLPVKIEACITYALLHLLRL